jgi:hypothetical protein
MIDPVGKLAFAHGTLKASSPNVPTLNWERPAALAEARLMCDPPPEALVFETPGDLLTAAFKVLPFVRGPLPKPVFGEAITPAAREAFGLLAGTSLHEAADAFRVLRGEVDDFIVFARRYKDVWMAGALSAHAGALTFRFEDIWSQLPATRRFASYIMESVRDDPQDPARCIRETLPDVAPDARVMMDVREGGGFALTFWPVAGSGRVETP